MLTASMFALTLATAPPATQPPPAQQPAARKRPGLGLIVTGGCFVGLGAGTAIAGVIVGESWASWPAALIGLVLGAGIAGAGGGMISAGRRRADAGASAMQPRLLPALAVDRQGAQVGFTLRF